MEKAIFTTKRLVIRPLEEGDASAYYALNQAPAVHCFMPERVYSLEEAAREVRKRAGCRDATELAVCQKESGVWIGMLFGQWEKDTFSVCWNFLPAYCGKGYAYEAAKAYLDYLFGSLQARRIYAYVEEDNLASQHLCRKLGMRQEGLFREFISFVNGPDGLPIYENTMQFAILKKEWEARRTERREECARGNVPTESPEETNFAI